MTGQDKQATRVSEHRHRALAVGDTLRYCIENLLLLAGWPWEENVDTTGFLREYTTYVALNRLRRRIDRDLRQADLHKYMNPNYGQPLRDADEMRGFIAERQAGLASMEPARDFEDEAEQFRHLVQTDVAQAHAWVNGKWFLSHLAPTHTEKNPEQCRSEWLAYLVERGGSDDVRAVWSRIVGGNRPA